ncbi:MAG TPA: hypothetical protein VD966_11950, partial [Pyrinomonadaceae bacterium]|nr:hypothetical protein [Pyrinomonadaceae bacterium]
MKQCPRCEEEFADKFSFCPVDGAPLHHFVASTTRPSTPLSEQTLPAVAVEDESLNTSSAAAPPISREYHLTIIEDAGLSRRLWQELRAVAHESQLTWPEFKRDPLGFTKRSAVAYGQVAWRFLSNGNVAIALAAAVLSMALIVVGVVWLERN